MKLRIFILFILVFTLLAQERGIVRTVESFEKHLGDLDNETIFHTNAVEFYLESNPFGIKIGVDKLIEQLWCGKKLIRVRTITEMKEEYGYKNKVVLPKGKYKFRILDGEKLFAQSEEFEIK